MNTVDHRRIHHLNDAPVRPDGVFVLYWMQQSQRARCNQALEVAVARANELGKPVVVCFGLTADYPEANLRHYRFMLDGLADVHNHLRERGIAFVLRQGHPPDVAADLARDAAIVVCDRGYLRHQTGWRRELVKQLDCRCLRVEADAIIPVETASDKCEYAARTLRPKLHRQLGELLVLPHALPVQVRADQIRLPGLDPTAADDLCTHLSVDRGVSPVSALHRGGTEAAEARFSAFLKDHLQAYAANRNQPQTDHVSHMSKYLHFGHVSPVWLALQVTRGRDSKNVDAFIEELLVRRELALNFVTFCPDYDRYDALPEWARQTLAEHRDDPRPAIYERDDLVAAETHDPYWNAAMREMVDTGYMHNYMRMYWGKKILEWSASPRRAFELMLELNNRYFLDGRDANSYAGVAWVFGRHDRGWPEREVYGNVRSMTAGGLERKCEIQSYVQKIQRLKA